MFFFLFSLNTFVFSFPGKVDNKKLKVVKVPTPVIKRQKWLQYKQTKNLHSNPLHLVEMSDKQVKALLKTDGCVIIVAVKGNISIMKKFIIRMETPLN